MGLPQRLDPLKEGRIAGDGGGMRGQFWRKLPLQCLAFGAAVGARHGVERAQHAIQQLARRLERFDRVVKAGRIGAGGDGVDLGQVLGQRHL